MKNLLSFMFCWGIFFISGLTSIGAAEITADDLVYYTEHFPPHNYLEDNRIKGVSVDILELIWQKLGASKKREEILIVPWARAIKKLETKPNMVLFGMGFSQERAEKFHWVGPYYVHDLSLISKKSSPLAIPSLEHAKKFAIGVVRQDIGHQSLENIGFQRDLLDLSNDLNQLHEKFIRNRFELICYVKNTYFEYLTGQGIDPKEFQAVYQISMMKSGYGFSKKIPLSLIQKFKRALDQLKADHSVARILKKHNLE
jgi:polar amino acid transport system substrate-binding protein